MLADSDQADSSQKPPGLEALPPEGLSAPSAQKRKSSLDHPAHAKRAKLDEDGSRGSREALASAAAVAVDRSEQLPAEIWQHILSFVPPKALGRLLRLSKLFHGFLDPGASAVQLPSHRPGLQSVKPQPPNVIWRYSRLRYMSRIPPPLKGKTELDMWRLVCSPSCQVCRRKAEPESAYSAHRWHRGPGAKGVYPVFQFSVAVCGSCLVSKSVKVCDVLHDSSRLHTSHQCRRKPTFGRVAHTLPPTPLFRAS